MCARVFDFFLHCDMIINFSSTQRQVLSKKHEEQLSQLATSTANLDLALQSTRKSVYLHSYEYPLCFLCALDSICYNFAPDLH
jgi:hypothetical protein